MVKHIQNLAFIFPVMFYYLLEALLVGFFVMVVWKIFLSGLFGHLGYLQIVGIYWIIKMLFFNVFNLIQGLSQVPPPETEEPNTLTEKDFR